MLPPVVFPQSHLQTASMSEIVLSDVGEFFPPAQHGAVDTLLSMHGAMRKRIDELAELLSGELGGAVPYFMDGNSDERRHGRMRFGEVAGLFDAEGAIKALDADYWRRALDLTGVRDLMPQELRGTWDEDIEKMKTPPFAADWVETTITDLLNSRQRFFNEKVDGIFRALSRSHVTNRPEGFSTRFIIEYAYETGFSRHTSCPRYNFRGHMHDLRMVVAKFMGLADPEWGTTYNILHGIGRNGKWCSIDGGAIRIRAYLKGTAHVEVHPDMAWRLNCILANLHPRAIPSEFREPPKRKAREWATIEKPIASIIRHELHEAQRHARKAHKGADAHIVSVPYSVTDKHLRAQVRDILIALGGQQCKDDRDDYSFAYDPYYALDHLITVGTMPDEITHQYYPTPDDLARVLVDTLGPDDGEAQYLEPSAGRGAIAAHLPADRTTCVEIADLNAIVLRSKGYTVERTDFVAWARSAPKFDRIAMNPPFSQGRAEAHVKAAGALLAPGGRLSAILPASLRGRQLIPGASEGWSDEIRGAFPGVSVNVIIYTARMPA